MISITRVDPTRIKSIVGSKAPHEFGYIISLSATALKTDLRCDVEYHKKLN